MNTIDAFNISNDSIMVVYLGNRYLAQRGQPNFNNLRRALADERWADVPAHLTAGSSLTKWAKGKFRVEGSTLLYGSSPVPSDLSGRISEMASNGDDPTPLLNFYEKLLQNPSKRSVDQLWNFLNNLGIPLTTDGCFLAYKGVRQDYMDCHSGTIQNRPGAVIRMERNQISDDPEHACHQGLHVGAREYASSFGPTVVIVKVNPRDVVCVPNDHSFQKMRVCEYEVVGLDNGDYMPGTTMPDEDIPDLYDYDDEPDETEAAEAEAKTFFLNERQELPSVPAKPKATKRSKGFQKLDSMGIDELMECKYDTLRAYASRGLSIVGASRILGGKWSLVQAIVKARGQGTV